ncbi:hypothetical protein BOX15_Mlig014252g3, partial [Macrostomum lignano]
ISLAKNPSEAASHLSGLTHQHPVKPPHHHSGSGGYRLLSDLSAIDGAKKQWHSEPPPVVAAVAYQPLAGVPTYSGCVTSIPCAVRLRTVDSGCWEHLSQPSPSQDDAALNSSSCSDWWWKLEPLPGCRQSVSASSLLSADDEEIKSDSVTAALDERIEQLVRARASGLAADELAPYAEAAKTIPSVPAAAAQPLTSQLPLSGVGSSNLMSMPMHLEGVEEEEEAEVEDDEDDEAMLTAAYSTRARLVKSPDNKTNNKRKSQSRKPDIDRECPPGIAMAAYPQPIGYAADVAGVRLLPVRLPAPDEARRRHLLAERSAAVAVAAADASAADLAAGLSAASGRPRELVPYAGWTLREVQLAESVADANDDDDYDDDEAPRAHPEPERYQPLTQLTPYAGGEKILPGIAYSPFLVRQQMRTPRWQRRRRRLSIVERPLSDCRVDEAVLLNQRIFMLLPDLLFDDLKDLLPTVITVDSPEGRAPLPPSLSASSSSAPKPVTMAALARHRSARPPLCDTVRQNGMELALLRIGDAAFACDLRCPHAGGPMNFGQLVNDYNGDCLLRCPWHGYTFNLFANGEIHSPSSRTDLRLRMYPVERDQLGRLYIGYDQLSKLWFSYTPAEELF